MAYFARSGLSFIVSRISGLVSGAIYLKALRVGFPG
jgi:hypothetical protein